MKNVMGGASLEADIYLAADELIEDKRLHYRPSDADLDEFHPRATRTLYVGNLSTSSL
jgi:hypothetical protein